MHKTNMNKFNSIFIGKKNSYGRIMELARLIHSFICFIVLEGLCMPTTMLSSEDETMSKPWPCLQVSCKGQSGRWV